jgi:hypothetical protein
MLEQKLSRLVQAGIQLIPVDLDTHYILERDGFLALVERRENDFGGVGAAGLMTERGLAPLVWRKERGFFVVRGFEREASDEDVRLLRAFQQDLDGALRD